MAWNRELERMSRRRRRHEARRDRIERVKGTTPAWLNVKRRLCGNPDALTDHELLAITQF